jgi:hypothetical protein
MIILKLQGGMGNQMFQYAIGRRLAIDNNIELKFDRTFLDDKTPRPGYVVRDYDLSIFNVNVNFATAEEIFSYKTRFHNPLIERISNKLIGRKSTYILEEGLNYNVKYLALQDNCYLEGYFQSESYFETIKDIIKSEFTLKNDPSPFVAELENEIKNSTSVCVNVRRADFVTNSFHGTCDAAYYKRAEAFILEKVKNPTIYVFSDDLEWCKENLKFESPYKFVEHTYAGTKFQDYLRLMSACRHFILPNSSFAWWAAYLSKYEDKIVTVPPRWLSDPNFDIRSIILKDWNIV